jgi:hypothetical protein
MTEPDPFRDHADLIRAFEERPLTGQVKVPDHVLAALEAARRSAVPPAKQRFWQAGSLPHLTRLAAVLALLAAITWLLIPTTTPTARVVITSPGDEISETQPRIAWTSKDQPGQKYDVWILPAEGDHLTAPTLFVAKGVTSPVAFSQLQPSAEAAGTALQPGEDYRVLVCLADVGRMAGVPVPFKVKPAP